MYLYVGHGFHTLLYKILKSNLSQRLSSSDVCGGLILMLLKCVQTTLEPHLMHFQIVLYFPSPCILTLHSEAGFCSMQE